MNTKTTGEISEAFIAASLLGLGYSVSRPMGDNQRYDLILDAEGSLYKIQCKTIQEEQNGSLSFPTCSSYTHRGGSRKDYLGEVDFIMAYHHKTGQVYFEEVNESTPKTQRTLVFGGRGVLASSRELSKLTFP